MGNCDNRLRSPFVSSGTADKSEDNFITSEHREAIEAKRHSNSAV